MSRSLLQSLSKVSSMTFLSRISGFIRDVLVAQMFGVTAGYDAFLIAFKIPNFMRRLFAEGAFSQAFIPTLTQYKTEQSFEETQQLVNRVFGALFAVLCLVTLLGCFFSSALVTLVAPGFGGDRHDLASDLLKITFPYLLFISLTAFSGGILNTYGRFSGPAFTPVLLNVSFIACAIFLTPYLDIPIFSLAWAVFLGGLAQWLFQWPGLTRLRLWPKFEWNWRDPGVRHILYLMGPAILGASVVQINLFVDAIFASFLPVGSLAWLYYAERLIEFPLGMFGVALATVILPHLSERHTASGTESFRHSLDWALRWTVFGALPAAIGLYILAGPILTALFQYGAFTADDVQMTALSLSAMSIGLVAFIAIKILISAFYARHDTRFPVKVAICSLFLNVIFNFIFMGPFAHVGLAISSTIAAWFNVILLAWKLHQEGVYRYDIRWNRFLLRLFGAALVMVIGLWLLTPALYHWQQWGGARRMLSLCGLVLMGGALYGGAAWILGLRKVDLQLKK